MKLLKYAAICGVSLYSLSSAIAVAAIQAEAAPETAQDADADDQAIVVTARRIEESLAEVPVSVTVASQQQLETLAISNGESLDRLDPALQLTTSGGARQSFSPAIRAQRGDRSVISYFAEVPGMRPQFFDLSSIQVLKGPQGTLFGETATGGVLLFTPQRPRGEFEGYVTGEAGNYSYRMIEGALNVPIIPDLWSVRIAGQLRRRRGYTTVFFGQTGIQPTDADNVDTSEVRLTSLLTPAPNLSMQTVFIHSRNRLNGSGYIKNGVYDYLNTMRAVPAANAALAARFAFFSGQSPPAGQTWLQLEQGAFARQGQLGPRVSFANNTLDTDLRFTGFSNIINWDITDNLTFKNVTGYYWTSNGPNSGLNPDASEYPVADNLGNLGGICIQGISPDDCRNNGARNLTNESQFQANLLDGRLIAQAGFFYRKLFDAPWIGPSQFVVLGNSSAVPAASCTAFGLPGTPCLTLSRNRNHSQAVYGQATFEIVDGLRLTGGIRKTWDSNIVTESTAGPLATRSFQGQTINLSPFGSVPLAGANVTEFVTPGSSGISYTVGADWQPIDDMLVWFNHRRGYKGGGINRLLPLTDPNFAYGPETVVDYELGFRAGFNLGSMPVNTTLVLYRSNYDDIQRGTFGQVNGVYQSFVQNVASATIQGVEFSLALKPAPWFEISAGLAYTDATFNEWLETSTCARETFRIGCNGVASAAIPVFTNHVTGTVTVNGITEQFLPDAFSQVPKMRWNIRPMLRLDPISAQLRGLTVSANITHSSSFATQDSNWTRGLARKDVLAPPRTTVDLRFDWNDLPWIGRGIDLFAGITNLFDDTRVIAVLDATSTCDCVLANYSEPRMFYFGARYAF